MKGIVLGKGFLGTRIAEYLNFILSDFRVSDSNSLEKYFQSEKPDIVINAIGKTGIKNIDWCETHRKETWFANVRVPFFIANECAKRRIYFVHLGSGCIYYGDNNGKGFCEEDEPNFYGPQFYANTKIEAQKLLSKFPCLQLRIRMPIDDRPHPRNLIDKLKKYEKLIDIQNSMTTVPHMLEVIKELIERERQGIYNLTNPGTISAAEIMAIYKEIVDSSHEFKIMSLEELDKITAGKRSNCRLNIKKLEMERIKLPEIHEAVKECLLNYKKNIK